MLTYDWQKQINSAWKPKKRLAPKREVKINLCQKCLQEKIRVRMDYLKNIREKKYYTYYDISVWRCPRCGNIDKKYMRIEGKGTMGINSGKIYGGK